MELYPIFLSLKGRACLVVGDGPEACRRAQGLAHSGALVTMMSPKPQTTPEGVESVLIRAFQSEDPSQYWLVIAATEDINSDSTIATACEAQRTYCYSATNSERSSFILPAIVDRSPLLIAISSGGTAPALVRALKAKLESLLPAAYARVATIIGSHQELIKRSIPNKAERAQFWHHFLNGPVGELAFSRNEALLEQSLQQIITENKHSAPDHKSVGFVSLVGAGPGDPDLLTFRALRLIQSADVIVYDRLVSKAILDLHRDDAQLLYAGKAKSVHSMAQESINELLVNLAQQGHTVVRLKGGDPFIFGRGGEEIETLAERNIPFQVVPGITAASGCSAFAGIPLTHRDYAQSCVFVTGHLKNGDVNLNWQDLQDQTQTIVIYMGLTGLQRICEKLIAIGRSPDTPAALIEQGTTPDQRVHSSTLQDLPGHIESRHVKAPTLLIIGGVVTLREKLNWFDPARQKCD
jgi:uroporphyrin-III C-methyltransferase/precorrin-2 dehydrogenase/sirohydrochlorin ferrochelatase